MTYTHIPAVDTIPALSTCLVYLPCISIPALYTCLVYLSCISALYICRVLYTCFVYAYLPKADVFLQLIPLCYNKALGSLLMLMFVCLFSGQDAGPRYKTTSRACRIDSQCNSDVGEVCWWFFDGCPRGTCMCDPTWSFLDTSGECRPRESHYFAHQFNLMKFDVRAR